MLATVALLRAAGSREIGPLLTASHASMRDDFEITVPEVDVTASRRRGPGAYGARMTGGGFGGCVLALVPRRPPPTPWRGPFVEAYAERGFGEPGFFPAVPSHGASRIG